MSLVIYDDKAHFYEAVFSNRDSLKALLFKEIAAITKYTKDNNHRWFHSFLTSKNDAFIWVNRTNPLMPGVDGMHFAIHW